jgi:hypothetical protein
VIISTFAMFGISILAYQKKSYEYGIWHICGCGKKTILLNMITGIGAVGIIAGLLNIASILINPYLLRDGNSAYNTYNCIIDNSAIIYIVIYIMITAAISVSTAYSGYHSASPAEIRRKVSQ